VIPVPLFDFVSTDRWGEVEAWFEDADGRWRVAVGFVDRDGLVVELRPLEHPVQVGPMKDGPRR
jgi:hypothetical protein